MERSEITSFGANVKASPLPAAVLDLRVETAVPLALSFSPCDHVTTRQPSRRLMSVTVELLLGVLNEAAAQAESRQPTADSVLAFLSCTLLTQRCSTILGRCFQSRQSEPLHVW